MLQCCTFRAFAAAIAVAVVVAALGSPFQADNDDRATADSDGARGGIAGGIIGPDLDISTIDVLTKYGTVNGISGYAFNFVMCNLGDQRVNTIDCNDGTRFCNQHPINAQNIYRLKNDRFEQLGQKWIFHDYCGADASGPRCPGPCHNDGTCDSIGIGCTATHGAGLIADQANLGSKSEVNPWSGYFPYPYVLGAQQTGNAIYKRLQIHDSDLTPNSNQNSGVRYFAESQMICPDELPASRYNNVTYRQAIVTGTSAAPTLAFTTRDTVPQQPAILAWQAIDPTVQITIADAPNDGRFFLGTKVIDHGDGTWTYEYAVYNMNSDRAGGSFTVPIPGGVSVTNPGFHDVDYHSGEPFAGDDWTPTVGADAVEWRAGDYATNPNANALRWGTLYNFRFDATYGPVSGTIELGLFKPGAGSAVTFAASVPGPPCAGVLRGDANCDGHVDNFDVDPFVVALVDNAAYLANPLWCGNTCGADVDQDGRVSNFDIDPFLSCMIGSCP